MRGVQRPSAETGGEFARARLFAAVLPDADDGNCREHRVGDVAFLVRRVMQPVHNGVGWRQCPGEHYFWGQSDAADRQSTLAVAGHRADGEVVVGIDDKALLGGEIEEREHVARGDRGHERFLGIDVLRF